MSSSVYTKFKDIHVDAQLIPESLWLLVFYHHDSTHPAIAARINTLKSDKGPGGDVKFAMAIFGPLVSTTF